MSQLKIYNTLTRNLEDFIPGGEVKEKIEDYPTVTVYSCGPTVYSHAHIGNFRTFIFNDLIHRYLKFKGYKIDHAMNITDVEDKIIAGAKKNNLSIAEYTEKYTRIFFEDLEKLNIEKFEHYPKATDSMDAMDDLIKHLDKKGLIYEKDGSIYFSISKYNKYGVLSNLEDREIKTGIRYDTDEYDKDDIRDFALWKAPKEEDEPFWEISYGKGRPGWHIECSAMVRKLFGKTIDLHTGGVDLVFPHHENEIAQSEAAYDEPFTRYWLHSEHLKIEGSKMSKSEGNFYILDDLLEMGYSTRAIRYLLISAHYRKQLNFTFDGLKGADQTLSKIDNLLDELEGINNNGELKTIVKDHCEKLIEKFTTNMDNDLNIAGGVGNLFEFVHEINSIKHGEGLNSEEKDLIEDTLKRIDSVLGVIYFKEEKSEVDAERIEKLLEERREARANKDFQRSDEIRDLLLEEGIIIKDTQEGTQWRIK